MKEKKLKMKENLEKTRAKRLQDQAEDLPDQRRSPIPRTKDRSEGPEEKGRKDAKNETGSQRDDPSAPHERSSREWTFSTTKRQRREQSKQKLKDNPAILKAEQKFGGRKSR